MDKGWVMIHSFSQAFRADMAKEVLEENGIEAMVFNKSDSAYPFLGDIELYVKESDKEKAASVIKEIED